MADAKRDNNYVTTSLGVQLDDLSTPTPLVIDQTTGRLMTSSIITAPIPEALPTGSTMTNPSIVLGYDAGKLVTITQTIGTDDYQKTLSYTGDDLTGVSAWVKL